MLLILLQFISMAFSLGLLVIFARSGVDVLAGFGATVGFVSSEIFVQSLLSGRVSRTV